MTQCYDLAHFVLHGTIVRYLRILEDRGFLADLLQTSTARLVIAVLPMHIAKRSIAADVACPLSGSLSSRVAAHLSHKELFPAAGSLAVHLSQRRLHHCLLRTGATLQTLCDACSQTR